MLYKLLYLQHTFIGKIKFIAKHVERCRQLFANVLPFYIHNMPIFCYNIPC